MKRLLMMTLLLAAVAVPAMGQYLDSLNTDQNAAEAWDRIVRPNNTAVYGVGDMVADSVPRLLRFRGMARAAGGSFFLTNVKITTNNPTVTNGQARLYLFDDTVSVVTDTALFPLRTTDYRKYIDYVDLTFMAGPAGSTISVATASGYSILCRTRKYGSSTTKHYYYRDIYGVLTMQGAYTPVAYQWFDVEIGGVRQ